MHLPPEGQIFKDISKLADKLGAEVYLIGGYVRDLLLKRPSKDIDIVVVGSGIDFAQSLAETLKDARFNFFGNYGTAQVLTGDYHIEFVGARKESYSHHSRNPQVMEGTLEDDQNRRDLTINALGISLNSGSFGEVIDPFNGVGDLKQGIIRTPMEPDQTFSDDPLRMMRAIRFATQLGFSIEDKTLEGIRRNAERISIISQERITDELNKIILSSKPSTGFNYLFDTGLLQLIFPEMTALHGIDTIEGKSHKDNFYHTLQVLDNLCPMSDNLWLRWSAILHDIAKPATKRYSAEEGWTFHGHEDKGSRMVKPIFRKLRLPLNEHMKYVEKMVLLHLRPIVLAQEVVTDSAVRRLIVDAGDDITDLIKLCRSDITSKNERKVERFLKNLDIVEQKIAEVTEKDRLRNWQPPITGDHILATFEIKDPRHIGVLKTAVREAILDGEIDNDFDAAWNYMLNKARELHIERLIQ